MNSCLSTFESGLTNLVAYLESTESEASLVALLRERRDSLSDAEKNALAKIEASNIGRKQYIHSVAIISLYGLIERFVDSLIESYVHRVAAIVGSYDKLPAAITQRHLNLSLDLIKAIGDDRHRGALSQAAVVENLHLCLSNSATFRVNGAAFALHRGNLYLDKISEFLTAVGIDTSLRRLSITRKLSDCFADIYPDRNIREVADLDLSALYQPIDSLVDRRNEISHGVINVEDIESVGLLKNRCNFVGAFCHGLYIVVLQELMKHLTATSTSKTLGKPIAIYDSSIACFEISNARIAVGDFLVAKTGEALEPYRFGKIESLEIDKVRHEVLTTTDAVKFGAKVPFKAKENYEYFYLTDDTL